MTGIVLEFLYRLIVTLLILAPSLTAIVVAFTIIYNKDFGYKNNQKQDKEEHKEISSPNENKQNKTPHSPT